VLATSEIEIEIEIGDMCHVQMAARQCNANTNPLAEEHLYETRDMEMPWQYSSG
jgi:hypothetical protein